MKRRMRNSMILLATATAANATVLFQDSFSSVAVLSPEVGTWSGTPPANTTFASVADDGNWFGSGTGNRILKVLDDSTVGGLAMTANLTKPVAFGVIAFDLYEPSTSPSGVNTFLRVNFAGRRVEFQDGDTYPQGLTAGTTKEYAYDTKVAIAIYFNADTESRAINGTTVASGQVLTFVNGTLATTGTSLTIAPFSTVQFTTNHGAKTEFYLDNLTVTAGILPFAGTAILIR